MSSFHVLFALVLAAVAAFQIWLTVRVFRSKLYERRQKLMQVPLIWLVPVLGAGIVFSVLRADDAAERPTSSLRST